MRTGIVVFGHGSSVASANDAVRTMAAEAARQGAWELYETAFLEALPRLDDAVSKLAAAGANRVLVLPYFLTLGIHLQRDLPLLVDEPFPQTRRSDPRGASAPRAPGAEPHSGRSRFGDARHEGASGFQPGACPQYAAFRIRSAGLECRLCARAVSFFNPHVRRG